LTTSDRYVRGLSQTKLFEAGIGAIPAGASLNDPAVLWLVLACPDIDSLARRARVSERQTRRVLKQLEATPHLTIGKPVKDPDLARLVKQLRKEAKIGRSKHFNHVYFLRADLKGLLEQLGVEHDKRIAEQAVKHDKRRERSSEKRSSENRSRRQRAAHLDHPNLFDLPKTAVNMSAETAVNMSAETAVQHVRRNGGQHVRRNVFCTIRE
jgi:AraC-like DNA-binding protein